MAISFMQKLRLAFRGWSRRREDNAKRKEQEFLQRNVTWAKPAAATPSQSVAKPALAIDLEGLQVAYLDDSGKIAHYLDVESGEVVEFGAAERRDDITQNRARYKRVPIRDAKSEQNDRRDFAASLDSPIGVQLAASADAAAFRRLLSTDRTAERAWYNFKNDRATKAIAAWLKEIGL